MTLKQRKLAQNLASGMNGKASAIKAGYSPKCAKSIASETINHNLHVQSYLYRLMDKKGLTDSRLLDTLDGGLDATRVVSARIIVKSDDPTVKDETATSRTDDFIEVEDWPTRHKYLETGLKLRGHLTPDAKTDGGDRPLLIVTGPSHQTIVNAPKLYVTPTEHGHPDDSRA